MARRRVGKQSDQDPSIEIKGDGERKYTHPAYGQISVNRASGSMVLYGSDFEHHNFMVMRISQSELHRHLSHDWRHPRDEIIEVYLSESQWASMLSSINMGSGVPCTIAARHGIRMPTLPLRQQKDEAVREMDEVLRNAGRHVTEAMDRVATELEGISKAKKERITASLNKLFRELTDHIPFIQRSFDEHMENVVEQARTEVNAYAQNQVIQTGITALRWQSLPLLNKGESDTVEARADVSPPGDDVRDAQVSEASSAS